MVAASVGLHEPFVAGARNRFVLRRLAGVRPRISAAAVMKECGHRNLVNARCGRATLLACHSFNRNRAAIARSIGRQPVFGIGRSPTPLRVLRIAESVPLPIVSPPSRNAHLLVGWIGVDTTEQGTVILYGSVHDWS